MNNVLRSGLLAGAMCALAVASSHAIIPDPGASSTPGCLRTSPDGTLGTGLQVTVIGTNGLPIDSEEVRLILDSAACGALIQACPGQAYPVISGTTDASGQVTLEVFLSGCCISAAVGVLEADPGSVVLNTYGSIASTDADSPYDGLTGLGDFVLFQTAFLTADTCFDFDACNDFVELGDFVIFQNDFLAVCP